MRPAPGSSRCRDGPARSCRKNQARGGAGGSVASLRDPTRPVQVVQDQPRDHSPGGDDVRPVPARAPQRRGPAARARRRDEPRDGSVRVAPARSDVRGRDPERRIEGMKCSLRRWHLDEVFVKINGERRCFWRALDHEGEVLASFVTRTRDKKAALNFLKKAMRVELPEESDAQAWSVRSLRHGQAAILRCDPEGPGCGGPAGGRPLAQEPGGEFTPRAPTKGAGDAPLPADGKSAEVRLRPRLRQRPLQRRPQPLQPRGAASARHEGQPHCPC